MKITILTICPELFQSFLSSHVVRRAEKMGLAEVEVRDLRTYADGSFRKVDDSPFGGGRGLVLRCTPVFRALEQIRIEDEAAGGKGRFFPESADGRKQERPGTPSGPRRVTAVLTPAGTPYRQAAAHRFARADHLVLICGHYEGIDERVLDRADEAVSIGDYVLTGGELPAMVVADSVLRLLRGTLREGSAEEESFENGLLEYPQYTQPAEEEGAKIPGILLSGNHREIQRWRTAEALRVTLERRPDLLRDRKFTEAEWSALDAYAPKTAELLKKRTEEWKK